MDQKEIINVEVSRTLAHVALLAAWDGDGEAANQIFTALYKAKPKEPNIRICQAMVLACQERFKECTMLLLNVLADVPDNLNAKSLLGLIKFYINEDGWRNLLEEVVADGSDAHAVQMARNILTEHPSVVQQAPKRATGGYMTYA
jgi:hypothetical protein